MINSNINCDYAVYAKAEFTAESNNYLGYDLPFSIYFCYYPKTLELSQCNSGGVGGGTDKPYVYWSNYKPNEAVLQQLFYDGKILPLFPEDWKQRLPSTTTYTLIYNRDLMDNTDYYNQTIYGCVYIQYVGVDHYVRLDDYLGLDLAPAMPDSRNDIFFLYDLGQGIMNNSVISSLLNLNINGVTFFNVLFGGGFVVFATWCIVKWIIPL